MNNAVFLNLLTITDLLAYYGPKLIQTVSPSPNLTIPIWSILKFHTNHSHS